MDYDREEMVKRIRDMFDLKSKSSRVLAYRKVMVNAKLDSDIHWSREEQRLIDGIILSFRIKSEDLKYKSNDLRSSIIKDLKIEGNGMWIGDLKIVKTLDYPVYLVLNRHGAIKKHFLIEEDAMAYAFENAEFTKEIML